MLWTLLMIFVGCLIGWSVPQPAFAATITDWIADTWDSITGNSRADGITKDIVD